MYPVFSRHRSSAEYGRWVEGPGFFGVRARNVESRREIKNFVVLVNVLFEDEIEEREGEGGRVSSDGRLELPLPTGVAGSRLTYARSILGGKR